MDTTHVQAKPYILLPILYMWTKMKIKSVEIKEYETEFTVIIGKQFPEFERRLFALVRDFEELMEEQSHPCYGCTDPNGCTHCSKELEVLAMIDEDMDHQDYLDLQHDLMVEAYHEPEPSPEYDRIAEEVYRRRKEDEASMHYDRQSYFDPPWE